MSPFNAEEPLQWSIDFGVDEPSKIVWETEADTAYNLWFSETLSSPFIHVEGFPKNGTGESMEHQFDAGLKGFLRFDTAPLGFAFIPEGRFEMGDALDDGGGTESPVHTVFVSAFYMEINEVTLQLWNQVRTWGKENGYTDLPSGEGKGADHPVHSIGWWDAMKWCNARSEMEGRSPCYFEDADRLIVYRKRIRKIEHGEVDWSANGYRLPTEAEWEKAARGGLSGKRFPWGDTISQDQANYYNDGKKPYNLSTSVGFHPDAVGSKTPYTLPVRRFLPNNYGLYDLSGSVWEWCWDAYDNEYYRESAEIDPLGPEKVWRSRVVRGGSWVRTANDARCSFRRLGWSIGESDYGDDPDSDDFGNWNDFKDYGFRVAFRE